MNRRRETDNESLSDEEAIAEKLKSEAKAKNSKDKDKDDSRKVQNNEHFKLLEINFNKKELSDLIINLNDGQKIFYVNKFILVSFSEIFSKILTDPNWASSRAFDEDNLLKIDLKETEECAKYFEE